MNPSQKMIEAGVRDQEPCEPDHVEPEIGSRLDWAEDTSMVESMVLHLVSEHGVCEALHLDEVEAAVLHSEEHDREHPHPESDLRFSPACIMHELDLAAQHREATQALVGVGIPVQLLRT